MMKTLSVAASAFLALFAVGQLQAATAPPDPSPYVVGPPGYYSLTPATSASLDLASNSATFQAALLTWSQMINSEYGHEEEWFPTRKPPYTATNPQYLFDCVGALSYILYQGAPQAIADVYNFIGLTDALNGGHSVVPTAMAFANYFVSLNNTPSPDWQLITTISAIQPGDVLIVPTSFNQQINNPTPAYPGHAMLAAGAPMQLSDGSYALAVFDSTSTPASGGRGGHGFNDSRVWDPRNLPCAECASSDSGNGAGSTGPSGLGRGTIQITALQATYKTISPTTLWPNYPFEFSWSVDSNFFAPLIVARPVSTQGTAQIQCLFNWAETAHPTLFSPANAITQFSTPYLYRQYSKTNAYLGVSVADNTVYYQGPDGSRLPQGSLSGWLTTSNCQ